MSDNRDAKNENQNDANESVSNDPAINAETT